MLEEYYNLVHQEAKLVTTSPSYLFPLPFSFPLQVHERNADPFKSIRPALVPLVQNFTDAKALMTAATFRTQTTNNHH